EHWSYGLQPG
nr:luliberin,8-Gln [Gallus gallus]prf//0906295A luliberin [Gallus gallus]